MRNISAAKRDERAEYWKVQRSVGDLAGGHSGKFYESTQTLLALAGGAIKI